MNRNEFEERIRITFGFLDEQKVVFVNNSNIFKDLDKMFKKNLGITPNFFGVFFNVLKSVCSLKNIKAIQCKIYIIYKWKIG